jgi:hypothetical protein
VSNLGDSTVSVLLGNGDGTFAARVDYVTGAFPQAVAVAELSGDGKPDIVVVNFDDSTVSVLLGNGDGTFAAKVDYPTDAGPTVGVLLGNGDGTFQPNVGYATSRSPTAVAVADVNGDGNVDLAVTNAGGGVVSVLLGNGNGVFQPRLDFGRASARPSSPWPI